MKNIILDGDKTNHGGTVIASDHLLKIRGKAVAKVGDKVLCPKCHGVYTIVESENQLTYAGIKVALATMKTTCGAELIASQELANVK